MSMRTSILLFKLFTNSCKSTTMESFYKSRALFLHKYCKINDDRIECSTENIGELFSKLFHNHYCIRESIYCKKCAANYSHSHTIPKYF